MLHLFGAVVKDYFSLKRFYCGEGRVTGWGSFFKEILNGGEGKKSERGGSSF